MKNHLLKCMKSPKDVLKRINKEGNNNICDQIIEDLRMDQFEQSQSTSSNANHNASATVHNFFDRMNKEENVSTFKQINIYIFVHIKKIH